MKLNLIRGAKGAEEILTRIDPLDLSALPKAVVDRTHQAFGQDVTPEQSVLKILQDVRQEGDSAVRRTKYPPPTSDHDAVVGVAERHVIKRLTRAKYWKRLVVPRRSTVRRVKKKAITSDNSFIRVREEHATQSIRRPVGPCGLRAPRRPTVQSP